MEKLKTCFVGVGSIAKRHINNLRYVCRERHIPLTVDAFRRMPDNMSGVDHVYTHMQDVPSDYDVIFITNPTEYHLETLKEFHNKGKHFFIEKPLISPHQMKDALRFQRRNDSVYYIACPLRYHAVIQHIQQHVIKDDVISVRSISSSYLPDWRQGQDYRLTYSAHKALGGGVSIDLIHEWDYLTYLFGMPERVKHFSGKKSNLEIDSDDYSIYIAEFSDKIAELHLDYFGRKTIREILLITHDDTIAGDIVNNTITSLMTGKIIKFNEERDDYQRREIECFLDMICGNNTNVDEYNHALQVINLTQGIV